MTQVLWTVEVEGVKKRSQNYMDVKYGIPYTTPNWHFHGFHILLPPFYDIAFVLRSMHDLREEKEAWLPDCYRQIFRLYVFGPLGFKDYGSVALRCKM